MNTNMLRPSRRRRPTWRRCAARGVRFVEPGEGYLACGWIGKGRLAEPEEIAAEAAADHRPADRPCAGAASLVTAGPTYEDLDPVRYPREPVERTHGDRRRRRGRAARRRRDAGARADRGRTARRRANRRAVRSAREMHAAVSAERDAADAIVMAAAVADYTPAGGAGWRQDQEAGRRPDRAPRAHASTSSRTSGAGAPGAPVPVLVGFAAETRDVARVRAPEARGQAGRPDRRQRRVQADAGFEVDTNVATLRDGRRACRRARSKPRPRCARASSSTAVERRRTPRRASPFAQ